MVVPRDWSRTPHSEYVRRRDRSRVSITLRSLARMARVCDGTHSHGGHHSDIIYARHREGEGTCTRDRVRHWIYRGSVWCDEIDSFPEYREVGIWSGEWLDLIFCIEWYPDGSSPKWSDIWATPLRDDDNRQYSIYDQCWWYGDQGYRYDHGQGDPPAGYESGYSDVLWEWDRITESIRDQDHEWRIYEYRGDRSDERVRS